MRRRYHWRGTLLDRANAAAVRPSEGQYRPVRWPSFRLSSRPAVQTWWVMVISAFRVHGNAASSCLGNPNLAAKARCGGAWEHRPGLITAPQLSTPKPDNGKESKVRVIIK